MKICWHNAGHMTKMAAMPIYGKNPSKIFSETWYVVSGTPTHYNLFKWWPWVDLDIFHGKDKFGNLGFSIGKIENGVFFLETIEACDLKVVRCRQLIELINVWKVKVIFDLDPRAFTYEN